MNTEHPGFRVGDHVELTPDGQTFVTNSGRTFATGTITNVNHYWLWAKNQTSQRWCFRDNELQVVPRLRTCSLTLVS